VTKGREGGGQPWAGGLQLPLAGSLFFALKRKVAQAQWVKITKDNIRTNKIFILKIKNEITKNSGIT
jgi:hypothetical protein